MIVTPASLSNNTETIVLDFTYTKRDENVSISAINGNYIIDITGEVYQKSKHSKICQITIIGGDNRFVHEKGDRPKLTYMTTLQKITLANILREIGRKNEFATITSADEYLQSIGQSLLRGFTG